MIDRPSAEAAGSTDGAAGRPTAGLTIAINAQVDPFRPGGVESALQGLLAHLREQAGEERILLLATPKHAPAVEKMVGPDQQVVAWPFARPAPAPYRTMTRRWQRWQRRAGPLAAGVDALHWGWWQTRRALSHDPDVEQTDAFLRARGASVLHFAHPYRFATALPFLYEPWDLLHRHYPQFFDPAELRWRDRMYREGCEQARLVVTATRWTKRDIVEQYGVDPRKIAVIPRGPWITPDPPNVREIDRDRRALALPERFAFYPAITFPHKNHLRLLEALAILRDRHQITLPLICTGRPYEPHWTSVQECVRRLRLEEQVTFLEPISSDTLTLLYRSAWALVYPSLFEGLGLPILDALQHGLPVISSDAACLPEVGGEAALYFDPRRAESIVDALLTAHREPERLERTRQAAPAVLDRFSWPSAAATFLACYRKVAGAPLTPEQEALYAEATAS